MCVCVCGLYVCVYKCVCTSFFVCVVTATVFPQEIMTLAIKVATVYPKEILSSGNTVARHGYMTYTIAG